MLTITTGHAGRNCEGLRRRNFMRIGMLGLGGLSLAQLAVRPAQASAPSSFVRDKSIVLLCLAGGPSQYETFDPKPDGLDSSTSMLDTSPPRCLAFASHRTFRSSPSD